MATDSSRQTEMEWISEGTDLGDLGWWSRWDALNASASRNHPLLRSSFVRTASDHFGGNSVGRYSLRQGERDEEDRDVRDDERLHRRREWAGAKRDRRRGVAGHGVMVPASSVRGPWCAKHGLEAHNRCRVGRPWRRSHTTGPLSCPGSDRQRPVAPRARSIHRGGAESAARRIGCRRSHVSDRHTHSAGPNRNRGLVAAQACSLS